MIRVATHHPLDPFWGGKIHQTLRSSGGCTLSRWCAGRAYAPRAVVRHCARPRRAPGPILATLHAFLALAAVTPRGVTVCISNCCLYFARMWDLRRQLPSFRRTTSPTCLRYARGAPASRRSMCCLGVRLMGAHVLAWRCLQAFRACARSRGWPSLLVYVMNGSGARNYGVYVRF